MINLFLQKQNISNIGKPSTLIYILKMLVISLIFITASYQRISFFDQTGKDVFAYKNAVENFLSGINPYIWTVESFNNPDDPGNHGYAYLPGLMYIYSPLYIVSLLFSIPFQILWKIPVLLADIGVGVLLYIYFYKQKNNFLALIFSLLVWFFNPYFYIKGNYVFTDPLPIFFMFLSLFYLKKDDVLSGTFYALSIALKTFPYILLPIMLIKAKNKINFLLAGFIVAFTISIPFLTSYQDFITYLHGSIFVHSQRFVQGRPFLFYISYYYDVELFQIIPFEVYTYLASFLGFLFVPVLYYLFKVKDKYMLSLLVFLNFYLFTPVLNRTYTMWFLPILLVGTFNFSNKTKYKYLFYVLVTLYYAFYYWYLMQWKDGFHIWRP